MDLLNFRYQICIIETEIHISRTHYISVKELDEFHGQTKRLYTNRASGGNCYHCSADGDTDAGFTAGKETGQRRCLPK